MRTSPNSAAIQRTVRRMADRFNQASMDEVVPRDDIASLIPMELRRIYPTHHGLARRAIALLNKENGAVFATVNREGYRRLSHVTGAQYEITKGMARIRKAARRHRRSAVNAIRFANDSTPSERRQVSQGANNLELLERQARLAAIPHAPDTPPREMPDNFSWLRPDAPE